MTLEAVLTKRRRQFPWRELRDRETWQPGWLSSTAPRVLVIGAGLAGLTCAEELIRAGWSVTIVDKARGAGGRASTRRAGELRFDHGAQVLTPRDPRFLERVASWQLEGLVANWEGVRVQLRPGQVLDRQPCARLVGAPGMSSPIRELARAHGVRFGVRIEALTREPDGWRGLTGGEVLGPFDQVVLAIPAPQAVPLLEPIAPQLAEGAKQVEFAPCWATLVAFSKPLPVEWDSAQVENSPLAWIAHDTSKPGRPRGGSACWVLHASEAWSINHLERTPDWVARELLRALSELVSPLPDTLVLDAHRWLYARTLKSLGVPFLQDEELGISLCGDGYLGERLESAFLSGLALGEQLVPNSMA